MRRHRDSAKLVRLALCLVGLLPWGAAFAYVEVGPNDQRLSSTGPALDPARLAGSTAVAVSSAQGNFLVCWDGDDVADNEFEIYCDLLSATGTVVADDVQVSDMMPAGPSFDAVNPTVAYNSVDDEFLVCWEGDTTAEGQIDNHFEIFCRRLSSGGVPQGTQHRVSFMGYPDGIPDGTGDALRPSLAYNFRDNDYLVCWEGQEYWLIINPPNPVEQSVTALDEFEIYCQGLDSDGVAVGQRSRASENGGLGDPVYDAANAIVLYDSNVLTSNEFVICWESDDNADGMVDGETEIFCRNSTGTVPTARMSNQGPAGNASYDAVNVTVAFDSPRFRLLVCWEGDRTEAPINGEREIYCGEWNRSLAPTVASRRVTTIGADGDASRDATEPEAVFNGSDGWGLCFKQNESGIREVGCQLLAPNLGLFGPEGETVSELYVGSGDYSNVFDRIAMVRSPANDEWLVTWQADAETAGLADEEFEIFAQRVDPARIFADGFESGNSNRWSATTP